MRRFAVCTWLSNRAQKFGKDEDGAILILSLMLFVCMVVAGGLAVDLANHERTRTYMQTHLDNAVLAAASLSQGVDSEEVVMSYMSSAGLDSDKVKVETSIEEIGGILVGRTVRATIGGGVNTRFFRFFDIDSLGLNIESQATERVEDIEISLVLDMSGSMDNYTSDWSGKKIDLLKASAKSFVDAVLSEAEEGRVSISIIPYSTKVNAGPELLKHYNTTQEHNYSHCIDFDTEDYSSLSIETGTRLQRTGHFQFQAMSEHNMHQGQWTCRIDEGFDITPLSSSADDLKAQIDSLTAEGSTSIDMGAKWGLALLDPSAQGPVDSLISEGLIDPAFRGRPHPHKSQNNMKVLVVMTDGKNDDEFLLRPEYASGGTNVYRFIGGNGEGPFFTVESLEQGYYQDNRNPYGETYFYAIHPEGSDRFWDNNNLKEYSAYQRYGDYITERKLTWPELWNEMSPLYYTYNLIARQYNYSRYWDNISVNEFQKIYTRVYPSVKDYRLRNICKAAREAGIVTYTIGMDVADEPSLGLLKECASTEAHYFDVDGMEIHTAFDMIAASISMLRLTK